MAPPTMPEPLAPHLPGWNWFAFALLSLLWAAAWRTLSRMLLRRSAPLRQLSRRCTSASRAKFPKNVAALLHAILGTLTGCAYNTQQICRARPRWNVGRATSRRSPLRASKSRSRSVTLGATRPSSHSRGRLLHRMVYLPIYHACDDDGRYNCPSLWHSASMVWPASFTGARL